MEQSRVQYIKDIKDATNAIKLQSLLTLVVDNLHATARMKHPPPSLLDYCRDFGKAENFGLSNTSPTGDPIIPFQSSQWIFLLLQTLNPIPVVPMNRTNLAKIREWASEQGQCVRRVRQLTVRQQTTKFSAGTLPMSAYGRNLPQNPLNSDVEEELIERRRV